METNLSKSEDLAIKKAREYFNRTGQTLTGWAKKHGYSPCMVSAVLNGKTKCMRGQAHEIAVKLGIKDGVIERTHSA